MAKSLLIKNGIVVTMDKERSVFKGGVLVEGERIIKVGDERSIGSEGASEVIDAKGGIITPGFICSHTHLYGILLRGANLNLPAPTDFTQNLQRIWWPMDQAMNHQDAYISALTASMELMRSGTTLFADTFSGPNAIEGVLDDIKKGVDEVGIRGVLAFEATQRRSHEEGYRGVEEDVRFIKKENGDRIMGMISLHAPFTVSDELIKYAIEKAGSLKATTTIHTAEGRWDLYHSMERYGKRTFERLHDLGALGNRTVVAHAVNINEDELQIIKKTGTNVAHNPLSNMLNAVGVPAVPHMLDEGINVSLGNDGYIFDVFENLRGVFLLHKVNMLDPRKISIMQALEMATINAAKAYHLEKDLGSLEVGKRADIVIIKPQLLPTPITVSSVYGHLVNSIDGDDVSDVVVNGELLLRDRVPTKVSYEQVNQKVLRMVGDYWARLKGVKEQVDVLKLGG
ncbi:MAG: amidohydrolase family protein [Nitrososphaerota archaeon]|nr:amidohydrolase family protein [Nitrososphaerota archaeon]